MSNVSAFPAPERQLDRDADFYIKELDKANMKLDRCLNQLELIEALTDDRRTAKRIRTFLQKEGVWPQSPQKD